MRFIPCQVAAPDGTKFEATQVRFSYQVESLSADRRTIASLLYRESMEVVAPSVCDSECVVLSVKEYGVVDPPRTSACPAEKGDDCFRFLGGYEILHDKSCGVSLDEYTLSTLSAQSEALALVVREELGTTIESVEFVPLTTTTSWNGWGISMVTLFTLVVTALAAMLIFLNRRMCCGKSSSSRALDEPLPLVSQPSKATTSPSEEEEEADDIDTMERTRSGSSSEKADPVQKEPSILDWLTSIRTASSLSAVPEENQEGGATQVEEGSQENSDLVMERTLDPIDKEPSILSWLTSVHSRSSRSGKTHDDLNSAGATSIERGGDPPQEASVLNYARSKSPPALFQMSSLVHSSSSDEEDGFPEEFEREPTENDIIIKDTTTTDNSLPDSSLPSMTSEEELAEALFHHSKSHDGDDEKSDDKNQPVVDTSSFESESISEEEQWLDRVMTWMSGEQDSDMADAPDDEMRARILFPKLHPSDSRGDDDSNGSPVELTLKTYMAGGVDYVRNVEPKAGGNRKSKSVSL